MPLPPAIQNGFQRLADTIADRRAVPVADPRRLRACKIISHRGSHDNRRIRENTLAAFDLAAEAGVWGIEMDIRWTRDPEPVIYHDMNLTRLHGRPEAIASLTSSELKNICPDIPLLSEVIGRFGKKIHLMIEIKAQAWPPPRRQERRLLEILHDLEPVRDYHLMVLDPGILEPFTRVPPRVRVAIAEGWPASLSRWVRRHKWGGLCGHFLLVSNTMLRRHHENHQSVGTGYIGSANCLFRELNRGVDWIFSNHAVDLQKELDSYLDI